MKISIITPSFNQGKYIDQCIKSVLNQGYPDFEHIIVDGGSTDNTLDILKSYKHLIWISEKDKGLSDALNKALKMVRGDIVGWLNTDDFYCSGTFIKVINQFKKQDVFWIVGYQKLLFESVNHISLGKIHEITSESLKRNCDNIRTNAMFFRNSVFNDFKGFDTSLKMVMDYDLCLKLSKKYQIFNTKEYYHVMRLYDEQITNRNSRYQQTAEIISVAYKAKAFKVILFKILKVIKSDIKYFLKIILIKLGLISKKYHKFPIKRRKELI